MPTKKTYIKPILHTRKILSKRRRQTEGNARREYYRRYNTVCSKARTMRLWHSRLPGINALTLYGPEGVPQLQCSGITDLCAAFSEYALRASPLRFNQTLGLLCFLAALYYSTRWCFFLRKQTIPFPPHSGLHGEGLQLY